jgi:predicted O-methyltransferase YrrM
MTTRTLSLDDTLYQYILGTSLREHPVMADLRAANAGHPRASMQIAPEQGQFMALLVRLMEARRTLEIGVFTGYSTLAVALALPPDGQIVACDIDEEYTAVARTYWQKAGIAHKINLHLAPALDTLDALLADGQAGCFDFAFIDADKSGYDAYYERSLALVRRGGLIVIDNALWNGSVAYPSDEKDTRALQALNRKLHADERVDLALLPVADGLALARKR